MTDLAIISGSGFYDFPGLEKEKKVDIQTKYGKVPVITGELEGRAIAFISRHGINHALLPSLINHRANLSALKILEVQALVSTTVCGVLDPALPLAKLVVFKDIFFPENRLPGGGPCTIFDKAGHRDRGHYLFDRPFSEDLRTQLIVAAGDPMTDAVYAHVNGPRFNSKAEIRFLQNYASLVSQTAGPEVILAGELEIPCALLGFGVDYANGVSKIPTPVEELGENLKKSKGAFTAVIRNLARNFRKLKFRGFVYRFE